MSSITTLLNQIMQARYGEEVRGAIHDAIELCYLNNEEVEYGVTRDDICEPYGVNLFNPFTTVDNKTINDNGVAQDSSIYRISDWIDVSNFSKVTFKLFEYSGTVGFVFYQYSAKNESSFIRKTGNGSYIPGRTFNLDENATYLRIRLENEDNVNGYINPYKVMLVSGSQTIEDFVPYYTAIDKIARESFEGIENKLVLNENVFSGSSVNSIDSNSVYYVLNGTEALPAVSGSYLVETVIVNNTRVQVSYGLDSDNKGRRYFRTYANGTWTEWLSYDLDSVHYDISDEKTASQKSQARDNIDAASDKELKSLMLSIGCNAFVLKEAFPNSSGVVEYSRLWNMLCIEVSSDQIFNKIQIEASSERMCYAFYSGKPFIGSAAVGNRRYISSGGTLSAKNVRVDSGASWIAIRYSPDDFPVVNCASETLDRALLSGGQDLPNTYGYFYGKRGVIDDSAEFEVLGVRSTNLNSGDIVRISGKNMFHFQQSWTDVTKSNVKYIVDKTAGMITVKTNGVAQTSPSTSQSGDSQDRVFVGLNGANVHCLYSFKFQEDTVVSIAGNPSKPFAYRDACQLEVTDGSDDTSHVIRDRGNGITMIAKAGVEYGVRIAIAIDGVKVLQFRDDDGIVFRPQVEIGPKVTPFERYSGVDVVYSESDITSLLSTYNPMTTVVVESSQNGRIGIYYRKATIAKQTEGSNRILKKLASISTLHSHSKYAPTVTFIDDDTTNLDSVQRYHTIMSQLGVVGNFACIATNIEENSVGEIRMDELLQNYENEGFGMLFHCDLQRGTETEYFLPDSRRDINKCRKNVLDGLRKMPSFGLNNYMHWVTPYGVNDKDIQEIARRAGLDCIITTDTQTIIGNNANAERYNLPRFSFTMNVNANRTIRRIKAAVDTIKETNGWLLITTHAYEWPASLSVYPDEGTVMETVTPEQLMDRLVTYIKGNGVEITSFQSAWEKRKQLFYLNEAFGNL